MKTPAGCPPAFWRLWSGRLLAQAELADELAVALEVLVLQVDEQAPALTDLHQQAAAAVVVLLVDLEVLVELVDRRGQNCDLDVGRAGVVGAAAVLGREARLFVFGQGHGVTVSFSDSRVCRLRGSAAATDGSYQIRASQSKRRRRAQMSAGSFSWTIASLIASRSASSSGGRLVVA